MSVKMIWAQSSNGYIGKNGQLLFQIPDDMKRFKDLTDGHFVIMGRKTWESLPAKFRPLPNRVNVVLTSSPENFKENGGAVAAVDSLDSAIKFLRTLNHQKVMEGTPSEVRDIWIIGGETVYREGLQYADEIHVTNVLQSFMGDAQAPRIPESVFTRASVSSLSYHKDLAYQYVTYRRKP